MLLPGIVASGQAVTVGGSSYPPWLPQAPSGDRPSVFLNFANDHYWANSAQQIVAAIISDPALVSAGIGLVPDSGSNSPTVISDALAGMIASSSGTVVMEYIMAAQASDSLIICVNNSDDSAELYVVNPNANNGRNVISAYDASNNQETCDTIGISTPVILGTNKSAWNYSASKMVASTNGDANITGNASPNPLSFTNINEVVIGAFDGVSPPIHGGHFTLVTLAVYPIQPEVDLPTLSA